MCAELEKIWGREQTGARVWKISQMAPLGDRGSEVIDVCPKLVMFHLNM